MKVDEAFDEYLWAFQTGEKDENVLLHPPSIGFLISTFTSLVNEIISSEQSGESTWSLSVRYIGQRFPLHRRQIDEMDEWHLEDPEVKSIPSGKLIIPTTLLPGTTIESTTKIKK
jgi:hypothetical protein